MLNKETDGAEATYRSNQKLWKIICIVMLLAIIAVFGFFILPELSMSGKREFGSLEEIDFSSSQWLDEYIEKNAGAYDLYFSMNSAFVCGDDWGVITLTYVSEKSLEELRTLYKTSLGAEEHGRNDDASLHLSAELPQGKLDIVNYSSQVSSVIGLELVLEQTEYTKAAQQLEAAFPYDELHDIPALAEVLAGEEYGRYVRYIYDELNAFICGYKPVFSCAYLCSPDKIAVLRQALMDVCERNTYDNNNEVAYFEIDGNILGLAAAQNAAGEDLVAISYQFGA